MRPVDVFWSDACLAHDTGSGFWERPGPDGAEPWPWLDEPDPHPESAARLRTMREALRRGPVAEWVRWHDARPATAAELARAHDAAYLAGVERACAERTVVEDTTVVGPGSWDAITHAAGAAVGAVEAVLAGSARVGYALVRPPGHHAQRARADGYCLVDNVAVAAAAARAAGCERVAVVDWDVHHGNGTQDVFAGDDAVLTVSVHMRHGAWGPSHPQTGSPAESDASNVNVELSLGAGDLAYARAWEEVVAPVVRAHRPDVLLCASGFDASAFDPNGRHNVSAAGFHALGLAATALADEVAGGRLVLTQEGGYHRTYAALCLHELVAGLAGAPRPLLDDPLAYLPDDTAVDASRTDADLAAALAGAAAALRRPAAGRGR